MLKAAAFRYNVEQDLRTSSVNITKIFMLDFNLGRGTILLIVLPNFK